MIVETVQQQRESARRITTQRDYLHLLTHDFQNLLYTDDVTTEFNVNNIPDNRADTYRLYGLVATAALRYGYPSLDGISGRKIKHSYTRHVTDIVNQTGYLIYLAKLNQQANPIKADYIERAERKGLPYAQGIRAVFFPAEGGKVLHAMRTERDVRLMARTNVLNNRRLLEPDPMDEALAAIDFDPNAANLISDRAFYDEIIPQISPIVVDVFDATKLYIPGQNC